MVGCGGSIQLRDAGSNPVRRPLYLLGVIGSYTLWLTEGHIWCFVIFVIYVFLYLYAPSKEVKK